MQEEKLEQLRVVFRNVIKQAIKDAPNVWNLYSSPNSYVEKISNQLVCEVKNRINNKKEVKN